MTKVNLKCLALAVLIPVAMLMSGCKGLPIAPVEECKIYQAYGATPENSLIAAKIPDPCLAKRLITVSAKLPALEYERAYTDAFDEWAGKMEVLIQGNLTYADMQDLVLIEVAKLNKKAGMAMLIVSDSILVFNERGLLKDKDVELLLGLITHLRVEVAKMAMLVR